MEAEAFEALVDQAIEQLPSEFREALDNVAIMIQDWPTHEQLDYAEDRSELLGLYQGVPQTERGDNYNMAMPDTITLFRKPIERQCSSDDEVRQAVIDTLQHEIAHHFGTDEDTLRDIEGRRSRHR